jgi:GNAT superfamily N-acetyltransferase
MIVLPLTAFELAESALQEVECNHLFVRAVLEGTVDGEVWVDVWPEPRAFYVRHPYGMSLAFGDPDAFTRWTAFWNFLRDFGRNKAKDEWLQAWPPAVADAIDAFAKLAPEGRMERQVRVNFSFDPARFADYQPEAAGSSAGATILRTGVFEYEGLEGIVHPRCFWRDREAFLRDGVGFSLVCEGKVAATAFSAFIHGTQLEIGIETAPDFRGRGCAALVCRRLIDYCLKRELEPVWSCRLSNLASMRLAQRIGFEPIRELPYFRLLGSSSL